MHRTNTVNSTYTFLGIMAVLPCNGYTSVSESMTRLSKPMGIDNIGLKIYLLSLEI